MSPVECKTDRSNTVLCHLTAGTQVLQPQAFTTQLYCAPKSTKIYYLALHANYLVRSSTQNMYTLLNSTFFSGDNKEGITCSHTSRRQICSCPFPVLRSSYLHTVTLSCQYDKQRTEPPHSINQLAPSVTFTPAHLVEAHSYLSFSLCIELCLSGQPGGRRTQRLLHL